MKNAVLFLAALCLIASCDPTGGYTCSVTNHTSGTVFIYAGDSANLRIDTLASGVEKDIASYYHLGGRKEEAIVADSVAINVRKIMKDTASYKYNPHSPTRWTREDEQKRYVKLRLTLNNEDF